MVDNSSTSENTLVFDNGNGFVPPSSTQVSLYADDSNNLTVTCGSAGGFVIFNRISNSQPIKIYQVGGGTAKHFFFDTSNNTVLTFEPAANKNFIWQNVSLPTIGNTEGLSFIMGGSTWNIGTGIPHHMIDNTNTFVNDPTSGSYYFLYNDGSGNTKLAINGAGQFYGISSNILQGNGVPECRVQSETLGVTGTTSATWNFNTDFDWIVGVIKINSGSGSVALTLDYTDENQSSVNGEVMPLKKTDGTFASSATGAGTVWKIDNFNWSKAGTNPGGGASGNFPRTMHITITGTINFDIGYLIYGMW